MISARELIDSSPISRLQVRVIVLCALVSMAEGYDIISISLAVLPITDDWGISGGESGLLFSGGLIGMAVGSITLGPVGDRYGRRPLLIGSLVVITVGVALSAVAGDVTQLVLLRILTGLGMGGIIPSLPIIVSEYSPARKRSTLIALFAIGIPAGGVLGGAVGTLLMSSFGWRAAFVFGAVITAVTVGVAYLGIPESPDYLEARGTEAARKELAALIEAMNLPGTPGGAGTRDVIEVAPPGTAGSAALRSWALAATCVAFCLVNSAYFFGNTWTPKLLKLAGLSNNEGIGGGLLFSLGGAFGMLLLAVLTLRFASMRVTAAFVLAGALLFAVMASVSSRLGPTLVGAALLGLCLSAAYAGLYVMVPILFRPDARVSALGIAAGLGRIGSIATPLGVGVLVDRSWAVDSIFLVFVVPTLAAAVVITCASVRNARESTAAPEPGGVAARGASVR
ncbi:MFS transporter [Streptomyces sp. NBC_00876]|uniref:MFS transporter n=1 Tax=Streptomyces sp. NBC_00876 TaxID=2975853 RepID=UPI00386C5ECB|nr:MFS transporter [Streptomyces sp. NBC_00876]